MDKKRARIAYEIISTALCKLIGIPPERSNLGGVYPESDEIVRFEIVMEKEMDSCLRKFLLIPDKAGKWNRLFTVTLEINCSELSPAGTEGALKDAVASLLKDGKE